MNSSVLSLPLNVDNLRQQDIIVANGALHEFSYSYDLDEEAST